MTTFQAYFGPHTQIYTNEINFDWTRVGVTRPDLTQQVIKLQQRRILIPVTPKVKNKKGEFETIQDRALGELRNALEKALSRFEKRPPKFQENCHTNILHVHSCFNRAIKNLHSYCWEYQNSPKVTISPKVTKIPTVPKVPTVSKVPVPKPPFTVPPKTWNVVESVPRAWSLLKSTPKEKTGLLTKLDNVKYNRSNDIGIGSSRYNNKIFTTSKGGSSSSGLNNSLSITSRKGKIVSSQTNKPLVGDALEFPIIIDCDDEKHFKDGDREFPILLDSDDDDNKDFHVLAFDKNEFKSVKVEDDSLGDFIPVEPLTLSDLNEPERVFIRGDYASNEFYDLEAINSQGVRNLQGRRNFLVGTNLLQSVKKLKHGDIGYIKDLRTDLPPIPLITDETFYAMATGYHSFNEQWEALEFLGDRVLTSCLLKFAKKRYESKYCSKEIRKSVSVMATNKILAAYTVTLGLHNLNHMDFPVIVKLHADAFEAYFGAYYLAVGEPETCSYLEILMTPLFDLIVEHIASGNAISSTCDIASKYFSMPWMVGDRLK
ncbi:27984_t:CDS:2 [Dentiscutata erythropus]|uniref:27984_t:CDS:1 n=1 Tax=Dentiscutata erythropus TaxID=1348616 RepID=A0A9N9N962_9GLOM|nr:27984_t:CDS:2 [Dentiscutata erythropus]